MEKLIDALVKLLNVKSILTLTATGVFAYLSVGQLLSPEMFMTIYTVIVSFYFGTQYERARNGEATPATTKEEAAEK